MGSNLYALIWSGFEVGGERLLVTSFFFHFRGVFRMVAIMWGFPGKKKKKQAHRVSKEPFTGRWMGTGDLRWSHPVTICTGVMLVIQIRHRCSGITWSPAMCCGSVTTWTVQVQFTECRVDDALAFYCWFILRLCLFALQHFLCLWN